MMGPLLHGATFASCPSSIYAFTWWYTVVLFCIVFHPTQFESDMRSNVAERIYDLKFPSDVGIKAKVRHQKQLLVLKEESELKSTSDFWSDPQRFVVTGLWPWQYAHTHGPMSVRRHEKTIEINLYCSLVRFQKVTQLLASAEWLRCSKRRVCRGSALCLSWPAYVWRRSGLSGFENMCPLHVHMTTREIWGFWTFCEVIGWVFLHGVAVMFHWLIREAGGKCEKHMWAETWESLHQYKGRKWDFWLCVFVSMHCTSCLKELQQRARPKPWQHPFPHSLCSEQPCMTDPLIHCRPSHSASTDLQTHKT